MSSALDITRAVNPPRAAFLDYPLGHTTGEPHKPALQRQILVTALKAFAELTVPGEIKMLPFRWSLGESWKRSPLPPGNVARADTPQYEREEDRLRVEQGDLATCPVCRLPHECSIRYR